MISLGIIGVTGRMGRRVLELALADPSFKIASGCASDQSSSLGCDLGSLIGCGPIGLKVAKLEDLSNLNDIFIDFTHAHATEANLATALKWKRPIVIGATGHPPEIEKAIANAAQTIPILAAPNFSLGMALCKKTAASLAHVLQDCARIEISETHHVHKKDSPSGTALALAAAIGFDPSRIHSHRTGEVIGEHTIIFEFEGERIELKHEALSRDTFALGALRAAKFLVRQPPGLYTMSDVLKEDAEERTEGN